MPQYDKADIERRMKGAIESLKGDLAGLRTGRANTSLLDPVVCEVYGAMMPLSQVATVSAHNDPSVGELVAKAIEKVGAEGAEGGFDRQPEAMGGDHEPAAVEPVGDGPADEGEEEPGEAGGHRHSGDGRRFPGQEGGQQGQGGEADAVAEAIGARIGVVGLPEPFRPVLRALMLTGGDPLYLRAELGSHGLLPATGTVSTEPLWSPPGKIGGRYIAAFLESGEAGAALKDLV